MRGFCFLQICHILDVSYMCLKITNFDWDLQASLTYYFVNNSYKIQSLKHRIKDSDNLKITD